MLLVQVPVYHFGLLNRHSLASTAFRKATEGFIDRTFRGRRKFPPIQNHCCCV